MVTGANPAVQAFLRDGLPNFTRLARDADSMVSNIDKLVSSLRSNPSQLISGQKKPEFRR